MAPAGDPNKVAKDNQDSVHEDSLTAKKRERKGRVVKGMVEADANRARREDREKELQKKEASTPSRP